jgi:hypothetical protein
MHIECYEVLGVISDSIFPTDHLSVYDEASNNIVAWRLRAVV